ncbi:hypothetical protein OKW41_008879 [Paraburkholderia sp. UCT70]|uniref:hypothetical protein n=1 Tax=Paraburkholderia sp. UCT70 TaxID=2991068 RepID=UPI003D24150C
MEPIPLQGLLKKWDESMAGCDVIKVRFHAASARLFGEARGHAKIWHVRQTGKNG